MSRHRVSAYGHLEPPLAFIADERSRDHPTLGVSHSEVSGGAPVVVP